MSELAKLRLKGAADRRLKAGHLWIYSNEVDVAQTPLKSMQVGQQVVVENAAGKTIGIALANPKNLICARIVSRDIKHPLDRSMFVHRIQRALSLRQRCFPGPYYRLVYGDSDGLPGVVVDRFGDHLVVQIANAGMEQLLDELISALQKVLSPTSILLKNDGSFRQAEELPEYVDDALGTTPDVVTLEENGVKFLAPLRHGQKTGWFYDHRENRQRLQRYSQGCRVVDLFSYAGAWGLQALAGGAEEVVCVDSSGPALELARESAALNGWQDRLVTEQASVFDFLQERRAERQHYDIVVADPPAFIKRRKDQRSGEKGYHRLNQASMRVLSKDGILVSASCSMHLAQDTLLDVVRAAGRHIDREVQILEVGGQGPDHPVHPSIPETSYLKAVFARVMLT